MNRFGALAMTVCLASFTATQAHADGLPTETRHLLTAELAVEAAQAAMAACKAQGWNMTVTIADRSGLPKLVLIGDGAGPVVDDQQGAEPVNLGAEGRDAERRIRFGMAHRHDAAREHEARQHHFLDRSGQRVAADGAGFRFGDVGHVGCCHAGHTGIGRCMHRVMFCAALS